MANGTVNELAQAADLFETPVGGQCHAHEGGYGTSWEDANKSLM